MALQWIRGDFKTGNISESAILPVISNGDLVEPDINAGDSATLTVSRADLPSDWRTYLKVGDTMLALVDPNVTFATGVVWAGRVNKVNATVKGTVNIQVTGLNQHLSKRIITSVYNTTNADPTAGVTFTASTWQGVMKAIIQHCFSTTGIPGGSPMPPAILGTVDGTVSGTTFKYEVKNSDGLKYADALDEIRDKLSPGNEYRFNARWSSSAKTKIVFDAVIGTDAAPHIGESTTRTIVIADNVWKPLSFGQSASADKIASRLIGHSKFGEGTTGSDFTTKTSTAGTTLLEDEFFNPGTELTTAEMSAQLTSRLAFAALLDNEATFERSYDTDAELRTMLSYLGNMATFTGTEQATQFGTTMRIVGLSYSPEKKKITVSLLPKAAKYPKLPKDRRNDLGSDGGSGTGGTQTPLAPPGYTPPVIPPFTLPGDTHTEAESILTPVDMRHFSAWSELGDLTFNEPNRAANWHKQPDVNRSRFNYATGEMIGLATASRHLYGFDQTGGKLGLYKDRRSHRSTPKATDGFDHNKDLDVYSVNIVGMFDRDSNPYMNMSANSAPNADNYKKLVGTISYSSYSELEIDPVVFRSTIPGSNYVDTRVVSIADYNMFCTQDLQTVYVQVMVTTSLSQINSAAVAQGYKSYSITLSKVFKGVRDGTGAITTWEDLGSALTTEKNTDNEKVFFSTAIYEIQGQFHAFGGFLIPRVEDGVSAPALAPAYELKFYQHGHQIVNPASFIYAPTEIDLPGLTMLETGSTNESVELRAKFPYAINVDYSQEKMSIGISRGDKGKTSQYFSSSFSNLLNFQKILSTDREGTLYTNSAGNFVSTVEDGFRFRSKAPVFYRNHFFLFNASSTAVSASIALSSNYTSKQINHIRGKVGFLDTVAGALKLTNFTNSTAKDAYVVWNSTANSANNLGAFSNYRFRAVSYMDETRLVYGLEYFVYQGFLYIIADTTFSEYEYSQDYNSGSNHAKFKYWIGKFAVKDELL